MKVWVLRILTLAAFVSILMGCSKKEPAQPESSSPSSQVVHAVPMKPVEKAPAPAAAPAAAAAAIGYGTYKLWKWIRS
jgi:hypothetical protein